MNNHADVVVAGSGIVGLGAAYAAVKRGLSVIVVDRSADPNGATIRNFGHLCIGAQTGTARMYADIARPLWLELARDADFWLRESGTLVAARHTDELAVLNAAAATGGIEVFGADEAQRRIPVALGAVVGGAHIATDLQTNPREASAAIRAHLQSLGVQFRLRTAVVAVAPGLVRTSRGDITTETVVVAVNHDIDELFPELAEHSGIVRCSLDMLRGQIDLAAALDAPLLTGWSLARYGRFTELPETARMRERLHAERPDLAALDLNQMYTQLPDGTLLIGDTHAKGAAVSPFQGEGAQELLVREAELLFGAPVRVTERWQGVYASGREDFLVAEPADGVFALAATTGIGMTTGLGLTEHTLAARFGAPASLEGIHA